MKKDLKIKNISVKNNLVIFNLTHGKAAVSTFDGNEETRSQERSYWIMWDQSETLNSTFDKWKKGKKKTVNIDSDDYRLRVNEFDKEKDGKIIKAQCTWLIPVDLADDDDQEWD